MADQKAPQGLQDTDMDQITGASQTYLVDAPEQEPVAGPRGGGGAGKVKFERLTLKKYT